MSATTDTSSSRKKFQEKVLYVGPAVHSISREEVTVMPRAAISVSDGKIVAVEPVVSDSHLREIAKTFAPLYTFKLEEGQIMIPGMIDTHTHAPQFPNTGLGYDKPLLDWLDTYTYPVERQYSDVCKARQVYKDVVKSTLTSGTTTAVYFGTIHADSCRELAAMARLFQQRALVGKVCMDMNCPPELREDTEQSIEDTEEFINTILRTQHNQFPLVWPIITPRFAVTSSPELMTNLAKLASKYNLHIQTHLSENTEEIEEVRRLHPSSTNYTNVYDQANLLTRKTILAHCIHLDDGEIAILKERGCSVAHCPNSNLSLRSGLCDVRRLLNAGVNVSLGTDVAGGYSHTMLDAIRSCINTSTALSFGKNDYSPLTYHEAFYLATMGGAIALNMEDTLGNFEVGKYFDAVIIDTRKFPMIVHSNLTVGESFQKYIYTGDDRNVHRTVVNGKCTRAVE